jgi:hypothetical protein
MDTNKMNVFERFAREEFRSAGWMDENGDIEDDMQALICAGVLDLLNVFEKQGHSGTSAPYTLNMFQKLASFKPIAPITGEDWEWADVSGYGDGTRYQNKRCSSIFKDGDGNAYDIDGKVFWEWNVREDGSPYKFYYSNGGCHTPVTFPYTPGKREEVYRYSDATPSAPPQTEAGLL